MITVEVKGVPVRATSLLLQEAVWGKGLDGDLGSAALEEIGENNGGSWGEQDAVAVVAGGDQLP